jgi:subtilase family serine protease
MGANVTSPESHSITIPSGAVVGQTYYIGIYSDYDLAVSESSELNNASNAVAVTIVAPPKPDLIANTVSVSDTTVNPGQTITINWTARNQGQAAASSTQQGVMWSSNSTISLTDTLLGREFLGSMGVNASSPESHSITIPSNATPGSTYYIGVYADYDEAVGESDEGNNGSTGIAVTINQADVTVTDILMNGQNTLPNVRSGDTVSLDFDVLNQGAAPTIPDVHLRWYWGTSSGSIANYIDQGSLGTINGLASGETERETDASWTIPNLPAGTYWITAVIDWDNRVSESTENNNSRSESFTVIKPDLTASSVSVSDTTVNPGQTISVSWTARNQGQSGANSTQQGVMWSTDGSISRSDTLLEREFLGSMSAGGTSSESHSITIPANATPGSTYYIGVFADYDLTESESDEGNNASSAIAVTINQADLTVTNILMNGQNTLPTVRPGDNVALDFDVLNQGTATTIADVHVRWYWGTTSGAITNYIEEGSVGTFNGLAPAESERETDASWTIPNLTPGTYWLTGVIDWDNRVAESAENNNFRSESFTVVPRQEITSVRWENQAGAAITGPVSQGTQLFLAVYADGFSSGQSFTADVFDNDPLPLPNDPAPNGTNIAVT